MKIEGTRISMRRGDTENFRYSAKTTGGAAYIEDGDEVVFTVKRHYLNQTPDLQIVASEIADGVARFSFAPSDTSGLGFGDYYYDVQIKRTVGGVVEIKTPTVGKLTLEIEVNHE